MNVSSPQITLSVPSALFLFFFAFTGPVGAEAVISISGDRTPATPYIASGQAAVEPPHASVGGKTFIRIIGDKQTTSPKPARKQAVRTEPGQSASAVDVGGKVAEKAEQDRLAETKGEQEEDAALQAAIARLEAARAALIKDSLLAVGTPAKLKKVTPSKQAGRRHKGVKKRHMKCLKYSTR